MRIAVAVMAGWFSGYAFAQDRERRRIERQIQAQRVNRPEVDTVREASAPTTAKGPDPAI